MRAFPGPIFIKIGKLANIDMYRSVITNLAQTAQQIEEIEVEIIYAPRHKVWLPLHRFSRNSHSEFHPKSVNKYEGSFSPLIKFIYCLYLSTTRIDSILREIKFGRKKGENPP
jgi:hypothetical protein